MLSNRMPNFSLSKWYMDCVSDAGDVFIGYAASLRWRGLAIHYSSTLKWRSGGDIRSRTSLQKISAPVITGTSLQWAPPPLAIEGTWNATVPPIERRLFESDNGIVEWRCLQPHGTAEIHFGNEPAIQGLGYAEHMSMTIPPWRLPIEELRWGRFLSKDDGLIWIEWRGPHPLSLILHNGIEVDGATITERDVTLDGKSLTLAFDKSHVLREGHLAETALSMIPGIGRILPASILRTHERKWRSHGILRRDEEIISEGWAIHEVVCFS